MMTRFTQMICLGTLAICFLWGLRDAATAQISDQTQTFSGPYRIAGMVLSKLDGRPLIRARITLRDTKNPQKLQAVITAEDGRFAFSSVPAGKFSLTGSKRGFLGAAYDQHDQYSTAIVTGAGLDTENLVLKLSPDAMISGKVLDEFGDPVRQASVHLYQNNHLEGVDQIREVSRAQTNDLGAYEMLRLRPGTYYVSADATPWYAVHPPSQDANAGGGAKRTGAVDRSLDVAYPITYYPDVTDSDDATPIPLRGGENIEIDIHLNPVPALRLLLHVPGDNQHGFVFPQLTQHSFDGTVFFNHSNGAMVSPGVFEVSGVPAGRYDIQLSRAGVGLKMIGVDLTSENQEVDTSSAEALSDVKVSVRMPAESKPAQIQIALLSKTNRRGGAGILDANGDAVIQQVASGRYELFLFGRGKAYAITQISAEGAEISGHTVTITAGSSPTVSLVAAEGSVTVEGTAMRDAKPFAGAMVVLVPKNVEGNRDLFRRDQSDLDGTFTLRNVTPGAYTLVAIENGWDLDWSQQDVIAVYAKHGRLLNVENTPGTPLRLDKPISVISR